jgi:hypothetical protein
MSKGRSVSNILWSGPNLILSIARAKIIVWAIANLRGSSRICIQANGQGKCR